MQIFGFMQESGLTSVRQPTTEPPCGSVLCILSIQLAHMRIGKLKTRYHGNLQRGSHTVPFSLRAYKSRNMSPFFHFCRAYSSCDGWHCAWHHSERSLRRLGGHSTGTVVWRTIHHSRRWYAVVFRKEKNVVCLILLVYWQHRGANSFT